MGLDVYLYRCPNRAEVRKIENQFDKRTTALWKDICGNGEFNKLPEAEQEQRRAKYTAACAVAAKELGMRKQEYGHGHPAVKKIELSSKKHRKHLFKIGYFRSSYNEGGIDSVLRRVGLGGLGEIMEAGDKYEFAPDWKQSRTRALDALAKLRQLTCSDIDVMCIEANQFIDVSELPQNQEEARMLVVKQLEQKRPEGSCLSYSNREGHYYLGGLEVVAMLPGVSDGLMRKSPCCYVAYRKKDGMKWYEQALEIVVETCDYVLNQPDPEHYYLHWSS